MTSPIRLSERQLHAVMTAARTVPTWKRRTVGDRLSLAPRQRLTAFAPP
jgi:hypothetical protein